MTKHTTRPDSLQPTTEMAFDVFDNWFDPIETEVRARSRQFIEELGQRPGLDGGRADLFACRASPGLDVAGGLR